MKLEKIGGLCFFASPTVLADKGEGSFAVIFDGGGHLLLNQKHSLSLRDGVFRIPYRFLREGENTLSLCTEEGSFRAEGLLKKDGFISPLGMDAADAVRLLSGEMLRLRQALRAQGEKIRALQEKNKERTLFS